MSADVTKMYDHLIKTGYSASEAQIGARYMSQNVVTLPGAILEYYEHETFVYPDERAGYFTYMNQRWRNQAQIKTMREAATHSDYYGSDPATLRVNPMSDPATLRVNPMSDPATLRVNPTEPYPILGHMARAPLRNERDRQRQV